MSRKKALSVPFHPGEILRHDILPAIAIPKCQIAHYLGCTRQNLDNLLKGRTRLTPLTALKLERLFGISAIAWCNMQRDYDLAKLKRQHGETLRELPSLDKV